MESFRCDARSMGVLVIAASALSTCYYYNVKFQLELPPCQLV